MSTSSTFAATDGDGYELNMGDESHATIAPPKLVKVGKRVAAFCAGLRVRRA